MEAKNAYLRDVHRFFRQLWSTHCTDELSTASGTVTLSGRTITAVTGTNLEFLLGANVPAPPADYPDLYIPSVGLSFSCPKKATKPAD